MAAAADAVIGGLNMQNLIVRVRGMFYHIVMLVVNADMVRKVNFGGAVGSGKRQQGLEIGDWRSEMALSVQCERDEDGRWLAKMPGAIAYGETIEEAIAKVEALALQAGAEQQAEHGTPYTTNASGPDLEVPSALAKPNIARRFKL